ncbi:TMV resistance protein N isoform X1 [Amborella trichopoda]|nr:TMV resistance protein N isoform X1 [Amborella trichopoda]|eukprot:XP_020526137.1 TMV resistance protein N isoform X1 [Amborella trichopoda]
MPVFLNFCYEDTGKSFTAHLNRVLNESGFSTFFSPTEQNQAISNLAGEIQRAIEECEVFITILSYNYASSVSCLEELSFRVSLRAVRSSVVPVFYGVEPSDARFQTGSFEGALEDQKKQNGLDEERVQRWKNALKHVADRSGRDMKNYRSEANLVHEIVKVVADKLNYMAPLHVADHLIGLDSRVDDVERLLDVSADGGVRMIGIHGMGGIGKTTLAKAIFNKIRSSFQCSCFLSDIREASRTHYGLVNLLKQLLKDLFNEEDPNISDADRGVSVFKNRIRSKKVLVILDDVDHQKQLEKLAGKHDWYCRGSRIITTTRDEHVLNVSNRVDRHHVYKLKELDYTQSLQLFSWWAFGRDQPTQEYAKLSKDVVSTAGGLPLALEVLGSSLWDKTTIEEWEETVEMLRNVPENDVILKLKVSFDYLIEEEKQIFLDIACFFIGMDRDYAVTIWKGCGLPASISIKRLSQRSLIKIDDENRLWMHDQLRDMGRRIVKLENLDDPGSRSRLWDQDEVFDVLKNHKGSGKVRGLILSVNNQGQSWKTEAFKPMSSLKLLSISFASLNGSFRSLPSGLVWLKWKKCPLQYLPDDFPYEKLAVLDLSNSLSELVWKNMLIPNLKVLDLRYCVKLNRIPNCSQYQNLEKLNLSNCWELVEIPNSISLLENLIYLNVNRCHLKELPSTISGLQSLQKLIISNNHGLDKLPEQLFSMKSLTELDMTSSGIQQLPDSIGNLKNLRILRLGFTNVRELPDSLGSLVNLEELDVNRCNIRELPDSLGTLVNLEKLNVNRCKILSRFPASMGRMRSLLYLNMVETATATLPHDFGLLSKLDKLNTIGCRQLKELPESFGSLTSLRTLEMNNNINLTRLPSTFSGLCSLGKFEATHCNLQGMIPDDFEKLCSLKILSLSFNNFHGLPSSLRGLSLLEQLLINGCQQLVAIPELPISLKKLDAGECTSLQTMPKLSHLCKLETLSVHRCVQLVAIPELPTSLKYLDAAVCTRLQTMPQLSHLSKLENLYIYGCEQLASIPQLPTNLKHLFADKTKSLQELLFRSRPLWLQISYMNCEQLVCIPELPSSL